MIKQMVSFTDPQYLALKQHAEELGITFAELVRRIVDFYRMQFDLTGENDMGLGNNPTVEIWVENAQGKMVKSRTYQHDDCLYVEGIKGRRYLVRVHNPTFGRVEVIASVDGLDVLTGKQAKIDANGLVITPRSTYDFEGFRVSNDEVAAFRFGEVASGYAAHKGDTSNVGVVGVALYQEQEDSFTITQTTINCGGGWKGPGRSSGMSLRSRWTCDAGEPTGRGYAKGITSESRGISTDFSNAIAPISAPVAQESGSVDISCQVETEERSGGDLDISPALATEFGEAITSKVGTTTFKRRTDNPWRVFTIRYESKENLIKLGIMPDDTELQEREQADPFPGSTKFCEPPPGWKDKRPVTRYGGPCR